jgi:hypothetical protein
MPRDIELIAEPGLDRAWDYVLGRLAKLQKNRQVDLATTFMEEVKSGIVPTIPDYYSWKNLSKKSQEPQILWFPHVGLDKFVAKWAVVLGRANPRSKETRQQALPAWLLREMDVYLKSVEPPTPTQTAVRAHFKDRAPRSLIDPCFDYLRPDRNRKKGPHGPRK